MDEDRKINPRARKLERVLATKLSEFLSSQITYALRKVHTVETKLLYKGPGKSTYKCSSFYGFTRKNFVKGIHTIKISRMY